MAANAQQTAMAAPSASSRNKPAALIMPSDGDRAHHRHFSTSSSGSSDQESPTTALSALDSSAPLILVHEPDEDDTPFEFSDDEDEGDDLVSPIFEIRRASIPPLPPSIVFLYLLTPYLKLGALSIINAQLPLKYGLSSLLIFAALSALGRQLWYMLARYLRKADLSDIVLDTFAKGRGKDRRREILRHVVRTGTGLLSVLLASTYLRQSINILRPFISTKFNSHISRLVLTIPLGLVVSFLSSADTLASRKVVYANWLSIGTYLSWLGCITISHSQGLLGPGAHWIEGGNFWQVTSTISFALCASSTLPLYASLKSVPYQVSTVKTPRSRSFRLLSFFSVVIAVLMLLPPVLFAAFPKSPATMSPLLPQGMPTPHALQIITAALSSATLILGIPSLVVTTPALPLPERIAHSATFNISRVLVIITVILLSFPPSNVSTMLNIILVLMTLTSTYFLPAFFHISVHIFKRPLAIVVPPRTPLVQTASLPQTSSPPTSSPSPRMVHDDLLLRKERALQKRQFRKRIVWDIGAWVLLGASVAWIAGAVCDLLGMW